MCHVPTPRTLAPAVRSSTGRVCVIVCVCVWGGGSDVLHQNRDPIITIVSIENPFKGYRKGS